MYLIKEIYIGAQYEHRNVKGSINLTSGPNNTPIHIDVSKISEIRESVGYWRKANAIHNWFVQNVQNVVDDCEEYEVEHNQLLELKSLCAQSVKLLDDTPATASDDGRFWDQGLLEYKLLLQPLEGFFFGNTGVNEWFYQDLQDTIAILDNLDPDGTYYYRASW